MRKEIPQPVWMLSSFEFSSAACSTTTTAAARSSSSGTQVWSGLEIALLMCLFSLSCPDRIYGQGTSYSREEARWINATWVDDLNFAAANALISGVAGGLFQLLQEGGSFKDGFAKGALGGGIVYGGKRIAAERFYGAGLLGRSVAGLGTSVTRSARSGEGVLGELVIPFGPVRVYWEREEGRVTVRPDITTLYWIFYGVLESRLKLDFGRSLSSGAAVFLTEGADFKDATGFARAGAIFLSREVSSPLDDVLIHERIHVIQWDNSLATWGEPLEGWVAGWFGDTVAPIYERLDLSISPFLLPTLTAILWRRGSDPFEVEADYLEVR